MSGRFTLDDMEMVALRKLVLERDGYRCRNPLCRRNLALEVHHVVPRSQGGPDTKENLVTLCANPCHALAGDSVLVILPDGDGGFKFYDTRRTVTCKACSRKILRGELIGVPHPNGGIRWVPAT